MGRKTAAPERPVAETKRIMLEAIGLGQSVEQACKAAGRSIKTWEAYRKNDPAFRKAVDELRSSGIDRSVKAAVERGEFPGFPEFSEKYLGARVFPHMLNVVDLLEGREPGWLHPAMTFERGEPDLTVVNVPPDHAKSTTLTVNYTAYRIARDPNIRVIIVSKTQAMAQKFLFSVKERLTHKRYAEWHARFGPKGGYAQGAESWSQNRFYINPDARDSGEKDPTVEAIGVRGHIYGARADLIILDDCVDLTNAHEYEKQIDWIQREVISRISASGSLLVVGTRMTSRDLYRELRDPARYPDEKSPWTYLAMPAVLEFADDPSDWVTLWPRSNLPEIGARGDMAVQGDDGLWPKWDGPRLAKKRSRLAAGGWAMVYQQQQVAEDAIFTQVAVKAAINGNRVAGVIPRGMVGCRPNGMDGLVVIAGLDPATTGATAAVVVGFEAASQKRYVLDVYNKAGTTPEQMREMIRAKSIQYGITEWRIEKNGFQGFLVHDREVNEFARAHGIIIKPHYTGMNKHDAGFGVASMATLFGGYEDGRQLIELPSTHRSEGVKTLIEQLVTWSPDAPKTQKTDAVMALWFADLAVRDRLMLMSHYARSHVDNPFATRYDLSRRTTVDLFDIDALRGVA